MKLPSNLLGNDLSSINKLNETHCKKIFYDVLRSVKGELLDWSAPIYPKNFYRIKVRVERHEYLVLLHEWYPYMGFSEVIDDHDCIYQFISLPVLEQEFNHHFIVLHESYLKKPLIWEDHELAKEDHADIDYWQPRSIGEVIFNHWD